MDSNHSSPPKTYIAPAYLLPIKSANTSLSKGWPWLHFSVPAQFFHGPPPRPMLCRDERTKLYQIWRRHLDSHQLSRIMFQISDMLFHFEMRQRWNSVASLQFSHFRLRCHLAFGIWAKLRLTFLQPTKAHLHQPTKCQRNRAMYGWVMIRPNVPAPFSPRVMGNAVAPYFYE